MNFTDFSDELPVWQADEGNTARLVRPSIYWRQAESDYKEFVSKGIVGYRVRNQFGDVKTMTFRNARRLKHLFDDGALTIVDYWRNYDDEYMALKGMDTEFSSLSSPWM